MPEPNTDGPPPVEHPEGEGPSIVIVQRSERDRRRSMLLILLLSLVIAYLVYRDILEYRTDRPEPPAIAEPPAIEAHPPPATVPDEVAVLVGRGEPGPDFAEDVEVIEPTIATSDPPRAIPEAAPVDIDLDPASRIDDGPDQGRPMPRGMPALDDLEPFGLGPSGDEPALAGLFPSEEAGPPIPGERAGQDARDDGILGTLPAGNDEPPIIREGVEEEAERLRGERLAARRGQQRREDERALRRLQDAVRLANRERQFFLISLGEVVRRQGLSSGPHIERLVSRVRRPSPPELEEAMERIRGSRTGIEWRIEMMRRLGISEPRIFEEMLLLQLRTVGNRGGPRDEMQARVFAARKLLSAPLPEVESSRRRDASPGR